MIQIFLCVFLISFSQILFKFASNYQQAHPELNYIYKFILNPWLYIACTMLVVATVLWIRVLNNNNLTTVYPIQSTAYIITALMAFLFFKEKISMINFIGYMLIVFGVYLAVLNKH